MTAPDVLYAAFIRSSLASARLLHLATAPIQRLPGVVDVLLADDLDLPTWHPGSPLSDLLARPLVVVDRVRFAGEVLGLVIATNAGEAFAAAVAAAALAELGVQPVVSSPLRAAVDEVLLFPDLDTNTVLTVVTESVDTAEPLLAEARHAGALAITTTIELARSLVGVGNQARLFSAKWAADGSLIVAAPTSDEGLLRDYLATAYQLDPRLILIASESPDQSVGLESAQLVEVLLLPALAKRFDVEVRWEPVGDELEHLNHGGGTRVSTTIGGDLDGSMRSVTTHVLQDAGAYPGLGAVQPLLGSQVFTGGYALADAAFAAATVVTNLPPVVPTPGSGRLDSMLGLEVSVDRFARGIDMDPVALRRRNLLLPFAFPFVTAGGATYAELHLLDALNTVDARSVAAGAVASGTALFVDLVAGWAEATPTTAPHGCVRVDVALESNEPTVSLRRITVALHPGTDASEGEPDLSSTAEGREPMRRLLIDCVRQSVRRAVGLCFDPGVTIDAFGRPMPSERGAGMREVDSIPGPLTISDENIEVILLDGLPAAFGADPGHNVHRLAEAVILGALPALVNALTTLFVAARVSHPSLDGLGPISLPFDPPVTLRRPGS